MKPNAKEVISPFIPEKNTGGQIKTLLNSPIAITIQKPVQVMIFVKKGTQEYYAKNAKLQKIMLNQAKLAVKNVDKKVI